MSTPTRLYRWFDAEGTLLYVGVTGDIMTRTSQHRRRAPWIGEADRMELDPTIFNTTEDALAAESAAIANEKPRHNKRGQTGMSGEEAEAIVRLIAYREIDAAVVDAHAAGLDPTRIARHAGEPVEWVHGILRKHAKPTAIHHINGDLRDNRPENLEIVDLETRAAKADTEEQS